MASPRSVFWNRELRLALSDVDETVADLYRPAESGMLDALTQLLDDGVFLVLITGQSRRECRTARHHESTGATSATNSGWCVQWRRALGLLDDRRAKRNGILHSGQRPHGRAKSSVANCYPATRNRIPSYPFPANADL